MCFRHRIALLATFAGMSLLLAACHSEPNAGSTTGSSGAAAQSSAASGGKKYVFAVIPKGTTHEFWKSVHAGADQAAQELGNVAIEWKGPLLESDIEGQISVVQDFVTKKVDGIILAPLDRDALVPYVKESSEAGVPVLIFDSALADESHIISYVATDNYKGGLLAGQRMGEVLKGKGNVIMLRYKPGSESTEQREKGFLDAIAKEYPDIKVLSENQYAGTTPESSLETARDILGKYRAEVNGIFAVCEPNAVGVLSALEDLQLDTKVTFVGFDPSPRLVSAMKEGKLQGIVLQDPVKMGYDSVMAMHKHLEKQVIEKRISTGEYVATPENCETPEMKKLLEPQRFGE